jgi:hypothetical protein
VVNGLGSKMREPILMGTIYCLRDSTEAGAWNLNI